MEIHWLNENSRNFLAKGYLKKGQTPEDRINFIAKKAKKEIELHSKSKKNYC